MITRALIALAFVAGTASAATAPPAGDDAFAVGNRAAVAGDPQKAAAAFEQSLKHGWSAAALFDLGNAYASTGDKPHAILSYDRALLLAPHDLAIAANLARVRAEAGLPVTSQPAIDRALARLTTDGWTWLALGTATLACIGIIALGWSFRRRGATTLVIAGAVATAVCGLAAARTAPEQARAVVLARTEARLAPVASADPVFTAAAGSEVHIEKRHGDFALVRDADRSGWLPATSVEPVVR